MRTIVRRILQEETADQWEDSDLDTYLNIGLQWVQRQVMAKDPEAFIWIDTADIVTDQRYYAKPASMLHEVELGYSEDPTSTEYGRVKRVAFDDMRTEQNPRWGVTDDMLETTAGAKYAHVGRWFYLGWAPDANITDGLQLIYVPELTMGADTDVPDLHPGLHYGVVLISSIFALNETPEDPGKFQTQLQEIVGQIPRYYYRSLADPLPLGLDLGKEYG
jgi:hypothetical protein